ncbi:hypothetical protein [Methylobacterium sp. 275MFSha3.1]|uniref:hypothetical protein n=1 Tax=Methylobacterium sp. 275MFSha3.1 TaxID=1502746 RepID=UPI0011151842|nr:hypothetical protein [Methylobacterium sp. 275MFSha3.1]
MSDEESADLGLSRQEGQGAVEAGVELERESAPAGFDQAVQDEMMHCHRREESLVRRTREDIGNLARCSSTYRAPCGSPT